MENRYGYCQCGCGKETSRRRQNHSKLGWIKGTPAPYCRGHMPKPWSGRKAQEWIVTQVDRGYETPCLEGSGSRNTDGYTRRRNRGAHIIAWEAVFGSVPVGFELDHKCNNRACENVEHLRLATHQQNTQNRSKSKNTSSKYKGVTWRKDLSKWGVMICGKHLGRFDNEDDAGRAYDQAAKELFGDYAKLNFE
jgi:hypothetical protein